MATPHDRPPCEAGRLPAAPLVDLVRESYALWRQEADLVAEAHVAWAGAASDERAPSAAAYIAALDREEAAARVYASALADCERWLRPGGG